MSSKLARSSAGENNSEDLREPVLLYDGHSSVKLEVTATCHRLVMRCQLSWICKVLVKLHADPSSDEVDDVSPPLIRPPSGRDDSLPLDVVRNIIEQRESTRPIHEDFLGRRSLAALVDLHDVLVANADFGAFADVLENLPEAEDNLAGASKAAKDASVDDATGVAVAFLLGERSTSFASKSPFAMALELMTVEEADESRTVRRSSASTLDKARDLADVHGEAFSAFLGAQRHLTAELFSGIVRLTLLRGERRAESFDGTGPLPLALRPLSSWTASDETARGIVQAADAAGGGHYLWVLSADVPVARVLSTSVTGFGAPFECEVIVGDACVGDSCSVVDCVDLDRGTPATQ